MKSACCTLLKLFSTKHCVNKNIWTQTQGGIYKYRYDIQIFLKLHNLSIASSAFLKHTTLPINIFNSIIIGVSFVEFP